jgi:hypothetical protein
LAALGLALVGDVAVVVVGTAFISEACIFAGMMVLVAVSGALGQREGSVQEVAGDQVVVRNGGEAFECQRGAYAYCEAKEFHGVCRRIGMLSVANTVSDTQRQCAHSRAALGREAIMIREGNKADADADGDNGGQTG